MLRDFISLLFPSSCIITQQPLAKGEKYISTHCAHQLPKFDLKATHEELHKKFYGIVTIKHAFAYYKFSKHNNVQKLLHQLKYNNCPEVGELAAQWYAYELAEAGYAKSFDLILPVPLHKTKQRKRGYNQCDSIAKGMSAVLEIPWHDKVLIKKKHTDSQTRKTRMQRFANAEEVYAIHHEPLIKGKRILLVDDVITTGATLSVCAHLLLQHGCQEVSIAALATPA